MSEKLCLQWNDFQENIKSAFGNLREDNDFKDVTLACKDGQQVNLLEKNKHPHPLIYMKGQKFEDMTAILDFLYSGEANVYQENLDSFLAIAEDLQLKGLMGNTDCSVETEGTETNKTIALTTHFTGDLEELEIKVKSLMEKSENFYAHQNRRADRCKVCEKEGESTMIKDHIEANHLEGIAIPCNLCEKTFRSRGGFKET